ncbi:MAG: tetratricopeptide repeat protein [Pseudomonadota bacterium]
MTEHSSAAAPRAPIQLLDQFGYPVTVLGAPEPERAVDAWNAAVRAFLAHGASTPAHLADALAAAPLGFPLAEAAKGFFLLLLGRPELRDTAADALRAAQHALPQATAREQAVAEALALYLSGSPARAADRLDAALSAAPGDGLLMKLVHGLRFVLGDLQGMRRSIEAALPAFTPSHPAYGYALGCHAFALEETGSYLAAERAGRAAVARAPDDAWGLHAVAHVMDMTNRTGDGVAWITSQTGKWGHCNNFGYHIWWHLALFHLDRGEISEVLRLYDAHIRHDHTDDYRDISNGASLLARLECEGVDVGDRWEEMASLAERRTEDGCVVFADLHYLLALGATGREAASGRLIGALQSAAQRKISCMDQVADAAGVAAAHGLHAFAMADYVQAHAALSSALPKLQRVGGSHAQRDVFERLAIEAALRSGLLTEARRAIQDRTRRRGALDAYAEIRLARIATLAEEAKIAAG